MVQIILLAVMLILSAFFSACETAFTGMNIVRMKYLARTKKTARIALKLHENYDRLLSTVLIGNNIVNIASASIAASIFIDNYGNIGAMLSTIIMTVVVLVFCEISPKSIAKERPETAALLFAFPLYCLYILLMPLNLIFDGWKKLLVIIFRIKKKHAAMTEEEFKIIVNEVKDSNVLNETEKDLIHKTLRYDETIISSVMTPAEQATMIDITTPLRAIKRLFEKTSFSRIPVYRGSRSNVIGILYLADFYELLLNNGGNIRALLKKPIWADPDSKISVQFKRFQKAKQHIAIVGKPNENCVGLVTMEDILEELMGEIEDESD